MQLLKSMADMVRDKLDAGVLPYDTPVKLWTGFGSGEPCAVCEQSIMPPGQSTNWTTTTGARPFGSTRDATVCGRPSGAGAASFRPSENIVAHERATYSRFATLAGLWS